MIRPTIIILSITAACSSTTSRDVSTSAATSVPRATDNVSVVLPNSMLTFVHQNDASRTVLHAPRDRVWTNLLAFQEELGMRAIELNAQATTATYVTQSKTIDGKRLSSYVDCGTTVTGPRTETHRVTIRLSEALESRGADTTIIHTTMQAFARDLGVSSDALACSSTGRLERLISRRVAEQVAAEALRSKN